MSVVKEAAEVAKEAAGAAKEVANSALDKVMPMLERLAEGIGTTVSELFAIYTAEAAASGIVWLVFWAMCTATAIISAVFFSCILIRIVKCKISNSYFGGCMCAVVISVILIFFFAIGININIVKAVNPKATACKALISDIERINRLRR